MSHIFTIKAYLLERKSSNMARRYAQQPEMNELVRHLAEDLIRLRMLVLYGHEGSPKDRKCGGMDRPSIIALDLQASGLPKVPLFSSSDLETILAARIVENRGFTKIYSDMLESVQKDPIMLASVSAMLNLEVVQRYKKSAEGSPITTMVGNSKSTSYCRLLMSID